MVTPTAPDGPASDAVSTFHTFSVDTHLFTELGDLLVGRDSTALAELVKNAYDADARVVTIFAEGLTDPDRGVVTVADNGVGMTEPDFLAGFLRVAGRGRQEGERRSRLYGRRFTGAKGIGRLAAHKLARLLEVDSIALMSGSAAPRTEIHAEIDWDEVERHSTLEELEKTSAISVTSQPLPSGTGTGTAIRLRRLRSAWSVQETNLFLAEMQTFQPPAVLTGPLPSTVIRKPLLFEAAKVRDTTRNDGGMTVEFEGEFALAHDYWQLLAEQATWILEIEALPGAAVSYALSATEHAAVDSPATVRMEFSLPHPHPETGPFFQARILCREGPWPRAVKDANLLRRSYGVRVYLEGFRVLPYGEPGNDWLGVDAQYTARGRNLPELATFKGLDPVKDEGLSSVPNTNYFGAVFLTHDGAPTLRMLVNREGFVPDQATDDLRRIVRGGLDLLTRVRARSSLEARHRRRRSRIGAGEAGLGLAIGDSLARATDFAKEARVLAADGNAKAATVNIAAAVKEVESVSRLARELISEAGLIRVLASLGTQMAAFIHETNGLLGAVVTIEAALRRIGEDPTLAIPTRHQLGLVVRSISDLRGRLERQAAYLTDVVSADARRRRMKMSLATRFDAAVRLFATQANRRQQNIRNDVPEALASPPMFPAELTTVMTNLLSNALKATGEDGMIRATGSQGKDGSIRFRLENTGVKVSASDGEKWFAPYASSSATVDSAMGQGMGLGLPITRSLLAEYGGQIAFATPSRGFDTAIEVVWPAES